MTWTVLVPHDMSEQADAALRLAAEWYLQRPAASGRDDEAKLVVLHVVEPFPDHTAAGQAAAGERWPAQAEAEAEAVFDHARALLSEMGVDAAVGTAWRYGRPGHEIVEYAADEDVDTIVMGSHGRTGLERLLLGSVAETVARRASVPVTIAR